MLNPASYVPKTAIIISDGVAYSHFFWGASCVATLRIRQYSCIRFLTCDAKHNPVRLDPQDSHHGTRQSHRQQGRKLVEVPRKKAHLTPGSGRIRDTSRGRNLLHTRHGSGRKYWSLAGTRTTAPYTGSHKKVTAYSAATDDGRRFFKTYGTGFNAGRSSGMSQK